VRRTNDTKVETGVKWFFDPAVGIPFVQAAPEEPEMEPEPLSALLETMDKDVLFTKSKAPYSHYVR
jgi:hypothetical protein